MRKQGPRRKSFSLPEIPSPPPPTSKVYAGPPKLSRVTSWSAKKKMGSSGISRCSSLTCRRPFRHPGVNALGTLHALQDIISHFA